MVYIGPALQSYCSFRVFIADTRAERVLSTLMWHTLFVHTPSASPTDNVVRKPSNILLTEALCFIPQQPTNQHAAIPQTHEQREAKIFVCEMACLLEAIDACIYLYVVHIPIVYFILQMIMLNYRIGDDGLQDKIHDGV